MASAKSTAALSGAASGAAIGTLVTPGFGTAVGAVAGGILGLVIGGQIQEEQEEAEASQRQIASESAQFQASARAQRLSLLQTGRRFADEGPKQQPSALASLAQSGVETPAQSKNSISPSGTF